MKQAVQRKAGTEGKEETPKKEEPKEIIPAVGQHGISRLKGRQEEPAKKGYGPCPPADEKENRQNHVDDRQENNKRRRAAEEIEVDSGKGVGFVKQAAGQDPLVGIEDDEVGRQNRKIDQEQGGQRDPKKSQRPKINAEDFFPLLPHLGTAPHSNFE